MTRHGITRSENGARHQSARGGSEADRGAGNLVASINRVPSLRGLKSHESHIRPEGLNLLPVNTHCPSLGVWDEQAGDGVLPCLKRAGHKLPPLKGESRLNRLPALCARQTRRYIVRH